jgi:hypothetical protein
MRKVAASIIEHPVTDRRREVTLKLFSWECLDLEGPACYKILRRGVVPF